MANEINAVCKKIKNNKMRQFHINKNIPKNDIGDLIKCKNQKKF